MQEKVLHFLKQKPGYVSGEDLGEHLKISRQALWKHIQELKILGYDIVAVPHLGYKLAAEPDRLFPFEIGHNLNTGFIGRKIHYFDTVPSTMDIAMQLGMEAAAEGTVVVSEAQSKGRGRLSREWFSPKYKGIYLSLILRPRILPGEAPLLTLLVAVSICEAIKDSVELEARIKWPNDIILQNKKLGGILTELSAEMDEVRFVAIGIGLNVNNEKKTLVEGATSLREHKKEAVDRVELLKAVLRATEENYLIFNQRGSQPVIEKWRNFSLTLGRRVKVFRQRAHLEGEAVDIDKDGGLLVRRDSGVIEKITAGDIVHSR